MIDLRLGQLLESGFVRPGAIKAAAHDEQHEERDEMASLFRFLNLLLLAFLFRLTLRCFALIG